MQEWNVIEKKEFEVGDRGDFIEITLKEHPENKEILYGISKGWKNLKGFKKYKSNIIMSQDSVNKLIYTLNSFKEDINK